MKDGFDYFKGFKQIQIEEVNVRKKQKKRYSFVENKFDQNGERVYNRNYKKRFMNDEFKGLHKKLLKYPQKLDKRIKKFMKTRQCRLLGIKSEMDLFIFAVNKLLDEHEED